ncbi:creatininase family protein [Coraliomargarita sp. SDUM461004]|uniref:Creatininase family protein n=1 Tax=Thalassobacterium sedimentorum TaxID=3041258 RepID=A0ABU1AF35_9BACT|nr:creatininase family protein [Coraliomargarita sp. SDUM461004]MDQ8193404.1 creatininase family protein [Coraliomargarita sp. SDUM461004]
MSWPSYRNRYLPAMTRGAIDTLPNKDKAFVVLPTGAIEQHGPQLPVGVDALLGQIYLDRAMPLLAEDAPVYVAPPIQAAKSNEHTGYPGTLILHRESLRQLIVSAGRQLSEWGFKRIGVLNTHGGNISVIKSALRELSLDYGMEVQVLSSPYEIDICARERAYGIHANEVESSLMYATTPDMVDPASATCCWTGTLDDPKILKSEFAPATYAWKTLDISRSGVVGDATVATREKGELWISRAAEALAARLTELVS